MRTSWVLVLVLWMPLGLTADDAVPPLWSIDGPRATHYLLGSVHLLPASAHPLPRPLEFAWTRARGLVLETDLAGLGGDALQVGLLESALETRAGGLRGQIGDALYAQLQDTASEIGMPLPACEQLRAWFCAMTLELLVLMQSGFLPEHGVDQHFHARALEAGRPIGALESARSQLDIFTTMDDDTSRQFLEATLKEAADGRESTARLYRMWRTGDLAGLEALVAELRDDYPALHDRLIARRNHAWMAPLRGFIEGEMPQLIIVGAAHLPGSDGLLALLDRAGYRLRRVTQVLAPLESAAAPAGLNPE